MKALVVLIKPFVITISHTCLYGGNERLWGPVWTTGVFLREKTPPDHRSYIGAHIRSNIMKYGKNDVE